MTMKATLEIALSEQIAKDIIASNALSSSSWSELALKLSIAGIELAFGTYQLIAASMLFDTCNNLHQVMLDELKATDCLDNFFNSEEALHMLYCMSHYGMTIFSESSISIITDAYERLDNSESFILESISVRKRRAAAFFSVIAQKFPTAIWIFYCKHQQALWKHDIMFCNSLLEHFSRLAQANDVRCNFAAMCSRMQTEQYVIMRQNAFMN